MTATVTIPLGTAAILTVPPVTPVSYETDTQHIVMFKHVDAVTMRIDPVKLGTVTVRQPPWGLGQDVVITVAAVGTTPAVSGGLTATFGAYTGAQNAQTVTVGEVPSGRAAIPAGTAGGYTPVTSGKPV